MLTLFAIWRGVAVFVVTEKDRIGLRTQQTLGHINVNSVSFSSGINDIIVLQESVSITELHNIAMLPLFCVMMAIANPC